MNKKVQSSKFKVQIIKRTIFPLISFFLVAFLILNITFSTGCKVYRFADVSIPDTVKTVHINYIENKAQYINTQLSPTLTDRLKQKITSQTRLTQTNGDNANWDISGSITNYSVSTSGISTNSSNQRQSSTNRLTVSVHVTVNKHQSNQPPEEYDVSRSFEFDANLTLQSAEAQLLDQMVRNLTDDIFNRIFSNW